MRAILILAAGLLLALPRVAYADPTYPAEIQAHLGLTYTPPCTLCHATSSGGIGTVKKPFGEAMLAAGLTTDIATLDPALDALAAAGTDTDGAGISDIQQLKEGIDPNTGASNVETEHFGCGLHIAQRRSNGLGQSLVAASLVLLVLSRRARSNARGQ